MTISRGQMNRQLYGLGSLVKKITGGAKKAVKKATKGITDILSSDIGKAALLGYGAYKLGPMLGGSGFKLPEFMSGNVGKTLGVGLAGSILGGAFAGKSQEEVQAITRDTDSLKSYLTQYYTNLNPELRQRPDLVEKFVNSQVVEYNKGRGGYAEAGRVGYSEGTYDDFEKFMMRRSEDMSERQKEELRKQFEMYMRSKDPTVEAAKGGRIGYALGDTASDNAMQAAGIEGLPIRQNPKGVKELDLRETGGFIPPVGIKEKEDDIPAMLSNNEFVFTADAVRGMGNGDVDVGAQRMYDMMKSLEAGGRV